MPTKFKDSVEEYNDILAKKDKGYRLRYKDVTLAGTRLISFEIILANSSGLKFDNDIYLSDEEMEDMIKWFSHKGVVLSCNNTCQIFWEKNGGGNI